MGAFLVWMPEMLPVSVVIPAYDRADLIGRAISSVQLQFPDPPAEVIVVDDGSRDATADIAEQLGARVVRHGSNKGTAASRNSGVVAATQPWVALLDSDDEWLPHHLGALWGMRNGYLLVANSALRCAADPSGDRVHGVVGRAPQVLNDPHSLLFPGNIIPASAVMARRDAIESVGGFRPPDGVEDLDLWIRILENGPGAVSPRIGAIYHIHPRQISQRVQRMQEGHLAVARRYKGKAWWSPTLIERQRGRAAWNNVKSSLRRRRPLDALQYAAELVAHPQRVLGAIGASIFRYQLRRGASTLRREGRLDSGRSLKLGDLSA
jgi:glycosyltransferase involved in cell wall biosynthesis